MYFCISCCPGLVTLGKEILNRNRGRGGSDDDDDDDDELSPLRSP